jgi:hypothetical protein
MAFPMETQPPANAKHEIHTSCTIFHYYITCYNETHIAAMASPTAVADDELSVHLEHATVEMMLHVSRR